MKIQLKNISKKYSKKVIFDNLNLDIKINDIMLITGESGSGKTTLCNMILAIDTKFSGEINFEKDIKISLMPQMNMLFENMSCYENIKTFSDNPNISELFKEVDLEGYENKLVSELSGGQKQRINLIRALCNEPDCIILDEPTANLDYDLAKSILELIKLFSNKGIKFIIITHDPLLINQSFDRIELKEQIQYHGDKIKINKLSGRKIPINLSTKKIVKSLKQSCKIPIKKNIIFMTLVTSLMIFTTLFFLAKNNEFESTIEGFFGKNGYILSSDHTVDLSNGCDKILEYETCSEGILPIVGYKYFTQEEIDYLSSYEGINNITTSYDVNGGGNSIYTYDLTQIDVDKYTKRVENYNQKMDDNVDVTQNNPLNTMPDDISKLQTYGSLAEYSVIFDVKYGEVRDLKEDEIIVSENVAKVLAYEKNITVEQLIGQEVTFETIDSENTISPDITYKVAWIYKSNDNKEMMFAPKITTNYDKLMTDHDSVFNEQFYFINDETTKQAFDEKVPTSTYDEMLNSGQEIPENDKILINALKKERETSESYQSILKTGYDTIYISLKDGYDYQMFLDYISAGPEPLNERTIQFKEQLLQNKAYNKNYGRIKWISLEIMIAFIVSAILLLLFTNSVSNEFKIIKLMGATAKSVTKINFLLLFKTVIISCIVGVVVTFIISTICNISGIYFTLYLTDYLKVIALVLSTYLILLMLVSYRIFKSISKVGINEG